MTNLNKNPQGDILVQEIGDSVIIYENKGGVLNPLMRLVAGAVTKIQIEYYRTVIKARIKQIEAETILKHFFDAQSAIDSLEIDESIKDEAKVKLHDAMHDILEKEIYDSIIENKQESTTFILNDVWDTDVPDLTPEYLGNTISPYLNAIIDLQHLIDTIKGRKYSHINIREIKRNSPISVSLDGASEAIQLIKDTVVPWRRKHAETMARLLEQEKSIEIEAKKAEVVDKRIVAREQANKLKLENEKLRLELQQAKMQLAVEMLNSLSHNMTQTEREAIIQKLLPILDTLSLGRLEMVSVK